MAHGELKNACQRDGGAACFVMEPDAEGADEVGKSIRTGKIVP